MIAIIDSIIAEIQPDDGNEETTTIPQFVKHPLFTQELRDALMADLDGEEESLSEYLCCMREAALSADRITTNYLTTTNEDAPMDEAEKTCSSVTTALVLFDAEAKLQGCTEELKGHKTAVETAITAGTQLPDTSQLGAHKE